MTLKRNTPNRRIVFSYLVPVHVEVEDGIVADVVVIDETPIRDPTLIKGDDDLFAQAVTDANDGRAWPSWRFGY
ncbi:hypothetical protein [Rhodoligotrophos defluvii]|uniref:hypothetical protein n=1 Tax=Rhodoligotrophos defluvii TaxID=2561934 RepID=UPI0010C97BBA|nr:hypothetical protein [Rhodoligotrophos defluvii]